ncbi:MAG: DUF924 family protein [Candidatus Binatia bacterium]
MVPAGAHHRLDQFSRTVYRGTAQSFAQDPQALALALDGMDIDHYAALETPWEKTFFLLPLAHSEGLTNQELAVKLSQDLVEGSSKELCEVLEFSAKQARGHRDVIARFGRHPHRNSILGRQSTRWPGGATTALAPGHFGNRTVLFPFALKPLGCEAVADSMTDYL